MKRFLGRVLSTIIGNLVTICIFIFIGIFILISSAIFGSSTKSIKHNSVLEITLDDKILESEMDNEISIFNFSTPTNFYLINIIDAINHAKTDENIKGISLKIENFNGGLTQAADIRNAITDFKKSGKFVYAYTNNSSQTSYYISSVADKIFQNPLGGVLLQGMGSEVMFFKNAGDKFGVDFQIIRYGEFKSAVEPFFRTDLSTENKLQLSELLGDLWKNNSLEISKDRKINYQEFQNITDSLYSYIPEIGIKHKIYDTIAQESQYDEFIFEKLALKSLKNKTKDEILKKHTIKLEDYYQTYDDNVSSDNLIAVLYASGSITEGDGFDGIQSKTYVKTIKEINENKDIKALVLRVNSPGGSANASEQILYELSQLNKNIPIVVSFGDVAASGGYYIAQSSNKIFAQPNTITGSIGVFGMIPNAKGLINSVGITTDGVETNKNSNQLKGIFSPLSSDAENIMKQSVVLIYKKFVNHVAKNRKMTFEQVNEIGEGRVWSGTSAKRIGLIDEFGDLKAAIEEASKLAKISDYKIENFPKRSEGLEELLNNLQNKNINSQIKKELGSDFTEVYNQLKEFNNQKGVQAKLPFAIKFN